MNRPLALLTLLVACEDNDYTGQVPAPILKSYVCDATIGGTENPGKDTCLDERDFDGDGLRNCDDDDVDQDGLRNVWDAGTFEFEISVGPAGGFGTDGALVVSPYESRTLAPTAWLSRSGQPGDTSLVATDVDALRLGSESLVGAELLVMVVQGSDAGQHQFVYVAEEAGDTLQIEPALKDAFDAEQVVVVQRVPHYTTVQVGSHGTLQPRAWTDGGSGILALRVQGSLTVAAGGRIDASGAGFSGGASATNTQGTAKPGESWTQPGAIAEGANNAGGGGGGPRDTDESICGAGGSFGSGGVDGLGWNDDGGVFAAAGDTYGDTLLSGWYLGSGGGAGSFDAESNGTCRSESGAGGAGGGFVMLFAYGGVDIDGQVLADGVDGVSAGSTCDELGGGGGGAGGQVLLVSPTVEGDGKVSLAGGEGGDDIVCGRNGCHSQNFGGEGGQGRLRLDADSLGGGLVTIGVTYKPGSTSSWPWKITQIFGHCDTDVDGDGFIDAACGGDDCMDSNAAVHPGAAEIPDDGIDNDCDSSDTCTRVLPWDAHLGGQD